MRFTQHDLEPGYNPTIPLSITWAKKDHCLQYIWFQTENVSLRISFSRLKILKLQGIVSHDELINFFTWYLDLINRSCQIIKVLKLLFYGKSIFSSCFQIEGGFYYLLSKTEECLTATLTGAVILHSNIKT